MEKISSPKIPKFSVLSFESSIKAFDNLFRDFFSHEYRVIEISKFFTQTGSVQNRWKFGLNFLCRVWPSGQRSKRRMIWS